MIIKYSAMNLLELSLKTIYDPIALLTKSKQSHEDNLSLSKEEMLSLFNSFTKSNLNAILKSDLLSLLEKEYQYFHHRLKCLPPCHIQHLINIGVLPKYLQLVTPPPCLAYLLGKSKKCP